MASMKRSDYTGDVENSPICAFVGGFLKSDFEAVGLNLLMFSTITYNSSYSDIISYLGEPSELNDYDVVYNFSENDVGIHIEFGFSDDNYINDEAQLRRIEIAL